ncbi:MAG: tetratricopeptide repeat-containing sensor histidine kinase [Bacteroidota bacterium]
MRKALLVFFYFFGPGIFCWAQSPELTVLRASLPHISDSTRYIDALNRMAMLLYEKNIDSTFYYTRQAREAANRLNYQKGKADALNNLGVYCDVKGNLQLALRYYNEAYSGYKNLKDSANCVQSLMNMAMVYRESGKDQRSVTFFQEALDAGKELSNDSIMSLAIYNYLLMYPARFQHDSLDYLIGKARNIAVKYQDYRTLVAIDQLVADDMIAHGKLEEGVALLDRTIDTLLSKKLYYVSMDIFTDIGDQLVKTNPARAASYYRQGLDIANQNGFMIYSQRMARKLFDFYSVRGDSLTAATYSRQLLSLIDEQEKLNNASGIDYLDYAVKDEQVKSLTAKSNYQVALLILAAIAFLLAIAVIISIRQNLKRTSRLHEQVSNQNNQMQKTLSALEQSQEDNTRMMQIVAHDLRNPIGAMYSATSILLDKSDRSDEERTLLEMIHTSGKNSLELVSNLLQVQFRAEGLKKEPVDIGEMLHYCVSLLLNKAEAKNQQINLQTLDIIVPASREKLWRVISNLIANAIKFSPSGAVIEVSMAYNTDRVRIMVFDHGIGIPPEIKEKVFDLLTKAKRKGTAGEEAFGLGLAIAKQIVEAHSGKIWFEDNAGGGTTFFVELPTE